MVKFINRLVNTFLVLTGIAAGVGLVYTVQPQLFQYAFETIGLSEQHIATAATLLTGVTVFGSLSKYLKGVVNAQELFHKSEVSRQLNLQNEKHQTELDEIKTSRIEEIKLFSDIINEVITKQNNSEKTNELILANLAITAQRNINSNLVSDEDKTAYTAFINAYNSRSTEEIKALYTEVTIEVEKEEVKPDNRSETLSALEDKLKGEI